jgi:hypothetical protein
MNIVIEKHNRRAYYIVGSPKSGFRGHCRICEANKVWHPKPYGWTQREARSLIQRHCLAEHDTLILPRNYSEEK